MYRQKGFTLVELVVVIVILGLLAATALPRFINVADKARGASLNGVAGGLRSAVALARAQYVVNGSTGANSVTMSGTPVSVSTGANGGIPTSATGGIGAAMPDPAGYTVSHDGTTSLYTPTNGGSAACRVEYTAATGNVVVQSGGAGSSCDAS